MAPIHDAAHRGDAETLRRLLSAGVSPDAVDDEDRGRTPLHNLCLTINQGDPAACLKLLFDAGANLDAVSLGGYTALHLAANFPNAKMVSLLLEAGANVNAADSTGWTALHFAACTAPNCVEVLLSAGAFVNARNDSGRTPFDIALSQNFRRAWPLFLRAAAEIPTNNTRPYIVRVRNAGGFRRYAQQHLARIASILETPLLPPELVRKVLEYWLHAGYY